MDKLWSVGKKAGIASVVMISLPVTVPVGLFLSVVGVSLAVPVGSAVLGYSVLKTVFGSEDKKPVEKTSCQAPRFLYDLQGENIHDGSVEDGARAGVVDDQNVLENGVMDHYWTDDSFVLKSSRLPEAIRTGSCSEDPAAEELEEGSDSLDSVQVSLFRSESCVDGESLVSRAGEDEESVSVDYELEVVGSTSVLLIAGLEIVELQVETEGSDGAPEIGSSSSLEVSVMDSETSFLSETEFHSAVPVVVDNADNFDQAFAISEAGFTVGALQPGFVTPEVHHALSGMEPVVVESATTDELQARPGEQASVMSAVIAELAAVSTMNDVAEDDSLELDGAPDLESNLLEVARLLSEQRNASLLETTLLAESLRAIPGNQDSVTPERLAELDLVVKVVDEAAVVVQDGGVSTEPSHELVEAVPDLSSDPELVDVPSAAAGVVFTTVEATEFDPLVETVAAPVVTGPLQFVNSTGVVEPAGLGTPAAKAFEEVGVSVDAEEKMNVEQAADEEDIVMGALIELEDGIVQIVEAGSTSSHLDVELPGTIVDGAHEAGNVVDNHFEHDTQPGVDHTSHSNNQETEAKLVMKVQKFPGPDSQIVVDFTEPNKQAGKTITVDVELEYFPQQGVCAEQEQLNGVADKESEEDELPLRIALNDQDSESLIPEQESDNMISDDWSNRTTHEKTKRNECEQLEDRADQQVESEVDAGEFSDEIHDRSSESEELNERSSGRQRHIITDEEESRENEMPEFCWESNNSFLSPSSNSMISV